MLSRAAGTSAGRALATTSHGARTVRVRTFFTSSRAATLRVAAGLTGYQRDDDDQGTHRTGHVPRSHADRPARRPHAHRAQLALSHRPEQRLSGDHAGEGSVTPGVRAASTPQIRVRCGVAARC